jgi:hypothetical protein
MESKTTIAAKQMPTTLDPKAYVSVRYAHIAILYLLAPGFGDPILLGS